MLRFLRIKHLAVIDSVEVEFDPGLNVLTGETGAGKSILVEAVGTPIAEALVATAFGLAAAIPAVVFYNYLTQRVKLFASEMDDFAMEFLNISERNFT